MQAHRQSPSPRRLQKHAKSQGPLLCQHYPASTLIRPCPTPVMAVAFRNVEDATLADDGSPHMTTNHLSNVPCLLPRRLERVRVSIASHARRSLPQMAGGSTIRIVTFEACSGFTRITARRIAQPPKATFVARLRPSQLPSQTARQLPDLSTIIRVESSSTGVSRPRGALPAPDSCSAALYANGLSSGRWDRVVGEHSC